VIEMQRDPQGKLTALGEPQFGDETEGGNPLLSALVAGFTAASTAGFN
jgi:hypothetical protein